MSDLDSMVQALPALWWASRKSRNRGVAFSRFSQAIWSIVAIAKVKARTWNEAINWLDSNYPGWRGIENPQIVNPGRLRK